MKSQWVMTASALFMGAIGLALTFAPGELLARSDVTPAHLVMVAAQIAGALYLGFAILNWMARESTIGGIYNRPLAMGNFTHFFVAGAALLKGGFWIAGAIYAIFAIAFGVLIFGGATKSLPPRS